MMPRLGPIQKKLIRWISTHEYVYIGASVVPPSNMELGGYSMDEVGPALERLLARGLIIQPKRGFYQNFSRNTPSIVEEAERSDFSNTWVEMDSEQCNALPLR